MFFSALQQRNIYCFNLEEAVVSQQIINYTKLKFPKKVHIFSMLCVPNETKLLAACSDSQIRIWSYKGFSALKSILDPGVPEKSYDSFDKV